ncbi:helix-turn-helix transcriptional regulator [soil metagenome]
MDDSATKSNLLGSFLRSRRAELTPDGLGLPPAHRQRRVSGLRREEVAQLAGISTDYYTRIEQGRLNTVSEPTLAAICRALLLTSDQESYLRTLAHKPPIARPTGGASIEAATRNLVANIDGVPAFILGRYLDVLGWNELACSLYLDFAELPSAHRNLVRLAFLDASVRAKYLDWESVGRNCVGFLRMDAASSPDDPRLAELVGELSVRDHDFRTWWASNEVSHHNTYGVKRYRHPTVGELTLDWQMYALMGSPETRLAFLVPAPNSSSENAIRTLALQSNT